MPETSLAAAPLRPALFVVTGGRDGTVQLWDAMLEQPRGLASSVATIPVGSPLVSVDAWATPDGVRLLSVSQAATPQTKVWQLAFAPRISSDPARPLDAFLQIDLQDPAFEAFITPGYRVAFFKQIVP